MSESQVATRMRPDLDIQDEIAAIIVSNPQLAADRHTIHVTVRGGVVILSGQTRTPIHRQLLVTLAEKVRGVASVQSDQLHDDESIRLQAGQMLPSGVLVNVNHGVVVLSGTVPEGASIEELASQVASLPGVTKVVTPL
jgi:osmotically-inducible protein OsmY